MKQIIKNVLLEFHEGNIPKALERPIIMPALPETVRKTWVLMGMRRTGKTWIAYQHMHQLEKEGIRMTCIPFWKWSFTKLL